MIKSIYPVLMTEKLTESCSFYKSYFDFIETFSSDWYISLLHPKGSELAIIDAKHETIPKLYRKPVQGVIINIEVEDATGLYQEILEKNAAMITMPLKDEEYGQRHFVIQDPNNVMVDVIENIPADEAFQNNYITGANPQ